MRKVWQLFPVAVLGLGLTFFVVGCPDTQKDKDKMQGGNTQGVMKGGNMEGGNMSGNDKGGGNMSGGNMAADNKGGGNMATNKVEKK